MGREKEKRKKYSLGSGKEGGNRLECRDGGIMGREKEKRKKYSLGSGKEGGNRLE